MKQPIVLLLVVLGWNWATPSSRAQSLLSFAGVSLDALDDHDRIWNVHRVELYHPPIVELQLQELHDALLQYAADHGGNAPDQLSALFVEDYVSNPSLFYSPGDSDESPHTIDNDVPNAPNSALVSYDYPFQGHLYSANSDDVVLVDNTLDNHAGLGRFVLYADGRTEFESSNPHVFSEICVDLPPRDDAIIRRAPDFLDAPYILPALGINAHVVGGPGDYSIMVASTLTDNILGTFESEGFGIINSASSYADMTLYFNELRAVAPDSGVTPIVMYVGFSAVLAVSASELFDSSYLQIIFGWTDQYQLRQVDGVVVNTDTGLLVRSIGSDVVLVEHRRIQRGDVEYVPEEEAVFLRGFVQLPIDLPTGIYRALFLKGFASAQFRVTPESEAGDTNRALLEVHLPVTDGNDQIKLFVPQRHGIEVVSSYGPDDLLVAVVRGDVNLDDEIDEADHNAFVAAYSRPISAIGYVEPPLAALQTFDFDGDGDLDCVDRAVLVEGWTGGNPPPAFVDCDLDNDRDGVANGDDDCPASTGNVLVDQRGCPRGDFNADGLVNLGDWDDFVNCENGIHLTFPDPPATIPQCRNSFDHDMNGTVDLLDFSQFQMAFGGS